jgi:two-component system, OmpR family, sensor histidine kinase CiaH
VTELGSEARINSAEASGTTTVSVSPSMTTVASGGASHGAGGGPAAVAAPMVRPDAISGPATDTPDGDLIRRTRRRLVLWSGGVTLVILVVLGVVLATAVQRSLAATGEAALRERADVLSGLVTGTLGPGLRGPELGLAFGGRGSGTFGMIVGPNGNVIGPAGNTVQGLPDTAAVAAARLNGSDVRESTIGGTPVRILSTSVARANSTYVVQVVGDRTTEARTMNVLLVVLGIGGLVALALSLIGGRLYAERALVPIRDSLRRQRDFAADASHELRTPLAVIRTSVDHLRRHPDAPVGSVGTALDDIGAEVDRLGELTNDLLLLARADSGALEIERQAVDVADVAASALSSLGPLAAQRGVTLRLDGVPALVSGDAVRLRQLVTILADNAIRHSPSPGTVTVTATTAGRRVTLAVEDAGQGIRDEDRPRLFERFWRAPDAPPGGSGLGLSIAEWIAHVHGGTIQASNRPTGGARFEVDLPAA